MKLSLNWIKDYVKIPEEIELSRIAYDLTMSTVEVEDIVNLDQKFQNIVLGNIKEIRDHPNAEKLKVCKTDIGNGHLRNIVCGGTNLKEGMNVAVANPGAMVHWHGKGKFVEIKNTEVRGVESCGMICASSEIGLFDLFPFTEESTIIDLSDFNAQPGTGLAEVLGLNDAILEIDNKSLSNRPDLWGHYGIAREISALYDLPLIEFDSFIPPLVPEFKTEIEDNSRCLRYIGVKFEKLSTQLSPFAIQSRIWRVGIRPVNIIVDITNYVMLATGQPTHAFDSDNIRGHISVRRAFDTEKLLLLNNQELTLTNEDLVITDEEKPIALAGVMGGVKDSILPNTNRIILEIASFEAIGIRRTALRHEARTEAAIRYEKGIDPDRCDIALSLAMQMFAKYFPNMLIAGFCDNYPSCLQKNIINVSLDWLAERLGKCIPNHDITRILERLGFIVSINGNVMRVIVPTWRSTGDVSIADDIMEEVARVHGYENFNPLSIKTEFNCSINQIEPNIDRRIREYLAFRCGMNEIYTYPWMSDEYVKAIFPDTDNIISLSTPPSPTERYIRSSLLPNICKAITDNLRYFDNFSIFESSQVFFDKNYKSPYDRKESLPLQQKYITGAFVSEPDHVKLLFRKAKGILEAMPYYVHIEPITFENAEKPVWADNVVWLNIIHNSKRVGNLALISKKVLLDCGIKKSAVMVFEFDIDSLKPYPSRTNKFAHLSEYPMNEYDISLLFDLSVKWNEIFESITSKHDPDDLLRGVSFVDEYKGPQIPVEKKSITFKLLIGSLSKTLTSGEIENYTGSIINQLIKKHGAQLRN